jgi:hypothetical protein
LGAQTIVQAGSASAFINVLVAEVTLPPSEALAGVPPVLFLALSSKGRAGMLSTEANRHFTIFPLPGSTAHAGEVFDQISAPTIVLALNFRTIVDVHLAQMTCEP